MYSDHRFTWEHYCYILRTGLDAGYRYIGFNDHPDGKIVYLRHDVDNDIGIAYRMAGVEYEMGVKSTYLVMIRSANYNLAESRNLHMLEEMVEMGHEIGLHFSLVDHPARDREHDLPELIRRDANILSMLLGREVRVFSFHNPTDGGQFQVEVPGLINAYHNKFFREAFYISESNMRWRDGCPCDVLVRDGHNAVQILIHPLSFADDLSSDDDVLIHFIRIKLADILKYNIGQNRTHREKGLSMREVLQQISNKEN
jgi:hypothetical protein